MSLVKLELKRITRRRGSFYGAMGTAAVIALLTLLLASPQDQDAWMNALGLPLVFGATIIGALAGSYDSSQGTMRYLVLTGQPRLKLVALRIPALLVAILLMAIPATLICIGAMASDSQSLDSIARTVGFSLTMALIWGTVSAVIGTLLRSSGAGIAVALVSFLAGTLLTDVVRESISTTVGDHLLPNSSYVLGMFGQVMEGDDPTTIGLVAATITTAIWLVGLLGIAALRVRRDEY
jgi:ABC-type transport system involved in multi-copper enzyme maturation permease subunit